MLECFSRGFGLSGGLKSLQSSLCSGGVEHCSLAVFAGFCSGLSSVDVLWFFVCFSHLRLIILTKLQHLKQQNPSAVQHSHLFFPVPFTIIFSRDVNEDFY